MDFVFDIYDQQWAKLIVNEDIMIDEMIGSIRVGALCFDIIMRESCYLSFDCYVYGYEDGYALAADGTPYAYADGFDLLFLSEESFNSFKERAVNEIKRFIEEPNIVNLKKYADTKTIKW